MQPIPLCQTIYLYVTLLTSWISSLHSKLSISFENDASKYRTLTTSTSHSLDTRPRSKQVHHPPSSLGKNRSPVGVYREEQMVPQQQRPRGRQRKWESCWTPCCRLKIWFDRWTDSEGRGENIISVKSSNFSRCMCGDVDERALGLNDGFYTSEERFITCSRG